MRILILLTFILIVACSKKPISIYNYEHIIYQDSTERKNVFIWNYDTALLK